MVVEEEEVVRAVKNSTPCFYRMLREGTGAHQNVNKDSPLLMIVEGPSANMVNDCPPVALRAFDLFV